MDFAPILCKLGAVHSTRRTRPAHDGESSLKAMIAVRDDVQQCSTLWWCDSAQPPRIRRRRCGGRANEVVELSIEGPPRPLIDTTSASPLQDTGLQCSRRISSNGNQDGLEGAGIKGITLVRLGSDLAAHLACRCSCPSDQPATITAACYFAQRFLLGRWGIRGASNASATMVMGASGRITMPD